MMTTKVLKCKKKWRLIGISLTYFITQSVQAEVFSDNYETGTYPSKNGMAGITYGGIAGYENGPKITKAAAKDGSYGVEFKFQGEPDQTRGTGSKLQYDFDKYWNDVWIQFDIKYPTNWNPRTDGSQGHAKFVMLWSDDYRDGHLSNFLNWNYTSYRPPGFMTYSYPTGPDSSGPQRGDLPSAPGVQYCQVPDPNKDLGRWMNIITHIKFSDPGKSEGVYQIWKDGKLILDKRNLPNDLKNGKGGANHAYILGPSQYGFNVDTSIYVDNLKISSEPLVYEHGHPPNPPTISHYVGEPYFLTSPFQEQQNIH